MDIIIGAGMTGISYANFTKNDFLILEAQPQIGGYCKTIKQSGYVWDYSGHFFHFRHPELELLVNKNINPSTIRTVNKHTQILYKDLYVDFPFQKNIHQLKKQEFIDCLYDLFAAKSGEKCNTFKEMVYANLGLSIAEKFLIPYNEKLYACNLDTLDHEAMGRFFPKASKEEIVLNFRKSSNNSYNDTFTYPTGGAIEYVNSLVENIDQSNISLSEKAIAVDLQHKTVTTSKGRTLHYDNLISTTPFPFLLDICGLEYNKEAFSWNKVLVLNLGFDRKGADTLNSWVYIPDKEISFYRFGYYDNIMGTDKMSMYVELGFAKDAKLESTEYYLKKVLEDLQRCGVISDHQLIDYHCVVMNPAYVHINSKSSSQIESIKSQLAKQDVYSIGRYGSWTYCSLEDNIVEARGMAQFIMNKHGV